MAQTPLIISQGLYSPTKISSETSESLQGVKTEYLKERERSGAVLMKSLFHECTFLSQIVVDGDVVV